MLIGLRCLKKTWDHQNAPVLQYITHTLIREAYNDSWLTNLQKLSLHYKLYENTVKDIVYV